MLATEAPTLYVRGCQFPGQDYPESRAAADRMRDQGWIVRNATEEPSEQPRSVQFRTNLEHLLRATAVLMLPGWRNDGRACLEREIAHELGLRIYEKEDAVPSMLDRFKPTRTERGYLVVGDLTEGGKVDVFPTLATCIPSGDPDEDPSVKSWHDSFAQKFEEGEPDVDLDEDAEVIHVNFDPTCKHPSKRGPSTAKTPGHPHTAPTTPGTNSLPAEGHPGWAALMAEVADVEPAADADPVRDLIAVMARLADIR